MNTGDRARLAQEEAQRLAIEREIARQQSQRQQPVNAQRYNVEDGTYDVTSGGRPVGAGQSISTSGIAPGQSVEYLEGAGTVDVTPRVRPRPGATRQNFSQTAEPIAAFVLNRAVLRGVRVGDGIPGYFAPPTLPTIANIYALVRGPNAQGSSTVFTVPPVGNLQGITPRYRKVSANYSRCEIGFSLWDDPMPEPITEDFFELYTEPRHTFTMGPNTQEVICYTAAQGTPLPDFPRFFPKVNDTCVWNAEFVLEWTFVEQYVVAHGNPAAVWVPGIPGGISEDFTRVYLLLGSDGSLVEVFRLSDEFSATVILAIDDQGTAHLSFRWEANQRHFQVTNGAVVQVPRNTSWKADFANRSQNNIPADADACINEYRNDNNRNIIGSNLYELDRSPTWADLTNPGGFTLNLIERAISGEGSVCTIGATTITEFTIFAPANQLSGRAGDFTKAAK